MHHFSDALRVSLPEGGDVAVLSVRVSDDRVDEYVVSAGAFGEMVSAYRQLDGSGENGWVGPDDIQVKVDWSHRVVGIRVRVSDRKREVYRLPAGQFEVMLAQFRSQGGGR